MDACLTQSLRRTSANKLCSSDQWRLRQLHDSAARRCSSAPQVAGGSKDATTSNSTARAREGGSWRSTHWKPAMKEVLMGIRSTDAIIDTDRIKGRKLTYWHGVKIKKASKERITFAGDDVLHKKCSACIEIVEQQTREAAEREQAAADPDNISLEKESKLASPENIRLVFSLFHSVPEVVDLDSIYKKQLFHELRIERHTAGSTVFHQWEPHTMICAILQGSVQLKSKHSGVTFQAGNLGIGEARTRFGRSILGSTTQNAALLTATCPEVTTLLCFDCERFTAVTNDSANVERIAKKEFLKCSPVFSSLSDDALNTLEALFTTATLEDKQVLCKEGSRVDHVYVVKRGFLRLLKAFIPKEDTSWSSRPASRTITGRTLMANNRTCLGARSTQKYDHKPTAACIEARTRLKHFDLGEIGPKDMIGENGVLQQVERSPPAQAPSAATSTLPAISTHTEQAPPSQPEDESAVEDYGGAVEDDGGSDHENGGGQDVSLTDAAEGASSSLVAGCRPRKPAFIVSATASGGRAEVYVANAYALKRLQTDDFCVCWKTAERLHAARAQAWTAQALAQQLRRQVEWEAYKRELLYQV
ncbi:unnamed protein product [Hapterophycus canaliculatus]